MDEWSIDMTSEKRIKKEATELIGDNLELSWHLAPDNSWRERWLTIQGSAPEVLGEECTGAKWPFKWSRED